MLSQGRDECRRGGIGKTRERRDVESDHLLHLLDFGIQQRRDGTDAKHRLTSMVMV
jgi:hypothetical protein